MSRFQSLCKEARSQQSSFFSLPLFRNTSTDHLLAFLFNLQEACIVNNFVRIFEFLLLCVTHFDSRSRPSTWQISFQALRAATRKASRVHMYAK